MHLHLQTAIRPALVVATLLTASACDGPKVAEVRLRPAGPLKFTEIGKGQKVQALAYDKKNRPLVEKKSTATFKSSDPNVFSVDKNGIVTSKGTGTATLEASVKGVTGTAEVQVTHVAKIVFKTEPPAKLKFGGDAIQVTVELRDEANRPVTGVKPRFAASDYCVEVDDSGRVKPLSVGECDITVTAQKASISHTFVVGD